MVLFCAANVLKGKTTCYCDLCMYEHCFSCCAKCLKEGGNESIFVHHSDETCFVCEYGYDAEFDEYKMFTCASCKNQCCNKCVKEIKGKILCNNCHSFEFYSHKT